MLRRGYQMMIGRLGSTEVDFVAEKQGEYTYYQVTADMTAEETFQRELRPLTLIRDNYEKIVLTADRLTVGNYNGIRVKISPTGCWKNKNKKDFVHPPKADFGFRGFLVSANLLFRAFSHFENLLFRANQDVLNLLFRDQRIRSTSPDFI